MSMRKPPPLDVSQLKETLGSSAVRQLAARELWSRGDLSYLVKDGAQRQFYDFIRATRTEDPRPIVGNLHRGAGKTFLEMILGFEECLREPTTGLVVGPTERQMLEISEPAVLFLLSKAPAEFRPTSSEGGRVLTFRNSNWPSSSFSRLRIVGAKEMAAHLRGYRARFIAADELAIFDAAEYVVGSVLTPIFAGQPRPLFLVVSTPPETSTHYFSSVLIPAAKRNGRYCEIPASKNRAFTPADEAAFLSVYGSKDSPAWQREFECSLESDPAALALPSFTRNKDDLVGEIERPAHLRAFDFADLGFIDATAVLFAYLHFDLQKLIVVDEIVGATMPTHKLIEACKSKEAEHFTPVQLKRIQRWADATPRELDDLRHGGLGFSAARTGDEKWDKWQGLARLETLFAQKKILIHPRCCSLIWQCLSATKNKQHSDLAKVDQAVAANSPILGHFDAVWALAYGAWQIRNAWMDSPYPALDQTPAAHRGLFRFLEPKKGPQIIDRPLDTYDASANVR